MALVSGHSFLHWNSVKVKMEDIENIEEDEYGFSRNYFLAKELGGASKRSAHKLSDIHIVDEQVIFRHFSS